MTTPPNQVTEGDDASPEFDEAQFKSDVKRTAQEESKQLAENPFISTVSLAVTAIQTHGQDEATVKKAFQAALLEEFSPNPGALNIPRYCVAKLDAELNRGGSPTLDPEMVEAVQGMMDKLGGRDV